MPRVAGPRALLTAALLGRCALAFRDGGSSRAGRSGRVAPTYDADQVPFADVASLFEAWEGSSYSSAASAPPARPAVRPVIFLEAATTFYDSSHDAAARAILSGGASKVNVSANTTAISAVLANGTVDAAVDAARVKQALPAKTWFALLRLTLSFTLVVKCLCIASNVILQASPFPLVQQMNHKKSTGEADSAPFIGICFCACQSSFYGLFAFIVTNKSGFLVLTYSNVVGVTFGAYYVFSFMRNCDSEKVLRITFNYLKAAAVIWGVQGAVIVSIPHFRALFFVGFTSSCCSLISAASLVTTVPEVLRTRCSKALPVPVLISAALSCCLWSICGFTLWDPYITLPNVVGLFACLFAISLAFRFPLELPAEPQHARDHAWSPRGDARMEEAEAAIPTTIGAESTEDYLEEHWSACGGTGGTD